MQRALDSATGLPSRLTRASWMLGLQMPAEVSRNLMVSGMAILRSRVSKAAVVDCHGGYVESELSTVGEPHARVCVDHET